MMQPPPPPTTPVRTHPTPVQVGWVYDNPDTLVEPAWIAAAQKVVAWLRVNMRDCSVTHTHTMQPGAPRVGKSVIRSSELCVFTSNFFTTIAECSVLQCVQVGNGSMLRAHDVDGLHAVVGILISYLSLAPPTLERSLTMSSNKRTREAAFGADDALAASKKVRMACVLSAADRKTLSELQLEALQHPAECVMETLRTLTTPENNGEVSCEYKHKRLTFTYAYTLGFDCLALMRLLRAALPIEIMDLMDVSLTVVGSERSVLTLVVRTSVTAVMRAEDEKYVEPDKYTRTPRGTPLRTPSRNGLENILDTLTRGQV